MSSKSDTKKKSAMSIGKFLSILKHKPKWIGDDVCGTTLVQFREFKGFSPSLEFYTRLEDNGTQRIYFEILDLNGYKEFDFIPLNSERRKNVIHVGMTYDVNTLDYAREIGYEEYISTPEEIAARIDESLKKLYSGKIKSEVS